MIEPRPELSKLSDYVAGKSIDEIREKYGLKKIVKLASNENPLGASPKAIDAYSKLSNILHLYPRGDAPSLISAIAKFYGINKDEVIIGNGSDEIIDMIGKAFIQKGDKCVGITPTFSVYKFTTISNGAKFIGIGESEHKTSLNDLLNAIDKNTRVAFICNPNNPTGAYYTETEILDFLEKAPKDVLIFLDEAYAEFATAKDYPKLTNKLSTYKNLLINRTFSKIYGLAGLRIGYAMANAQIIKSLWKIKPPFDVNQAAQVTAVAALKDFAHVQNSQKNNIKGIAYLTQELQKLNIKVLPTQANFICVHIGKSALKLVEFLEKNGMIVRYLKSFGLPEHIRITVGTQNENEFLIELIKKYIGEKI